MSVARGPERACHPAFSAAALITAASRGAVTYFSRNAELDLREISHHEIVFPQCIL